MKYSLRNTLVALVLLSPLGLLAQSAPNITLPFFDDFSYPASVPSSSYWEKETDAVVTRARAHKAPTVGVLTLDAAAANGLLHKNATTAAFQADIAASLPIVVEAGQDSLYLSFQFQPGGDAEAPARGDSLLVDFYDPDLAQWVNVWGAIYLAQRGRVEQFFRNTPRWVKSIVQQHETPQRYFFKAHIPVRDRRFVKTGFRFRFRNLASIIHDNTAPGRTANSSQWHVDLVYLNAHRTLNDTIVPDVACTEPLQTAFTEYSAVPYDSFYEYVQNRNTDPAETLGMQYENMGRNTNNVRRFFTIEDLTKKVTEQSYNGGNVNITPFKSESYQRTVSFPWSELAGSEVNVRIRGILQTDKNPKNTPFRWNDTVQTFLRCTDEYAYDNGEPTSGYGIVGVGAERAAVAMRFRPLKPTAIKAVRIWFNPIGDLKSRKRFRLCFWQDANGVPGNKVYEQLVTPPREESEVGRFYEIVLTTPITFKNAYFVGWEQLSADMINIAYDAHTPFKATIYSRTSAQWQKSKVEGALMFRLVCGGEGKDPELPTSACMPAIPESEVFPNPAQDQIYVKTAEEVANIALYSVQGVLVREGLPSNTYVGIAELPRGVYLVRLTYRNGIQDTKKLIVR